MNNLTQCLTAVASMARSWKITVIWRLTFLCAFAAVLGTLYLTLSPDPLPTRSTWRLRIPERDRSLTDGCEDGFTDEHRLAVIVPFRDRFEELLEFVPHMNRFLCKQKIRHRMIIVNQVDALRFNRASLINIGFLIGERLSCDYIAMHDVDLLPTNDNLSYSYPADGPFHVAAPELHPKYHYKKFVGGILLVTNDHFRLTNGLSNKFWGWGREDDEYYLRMMENNLEIRRPEGITTGNNTFKHFHDNLRRARDAARYGDQKAHSIRDRVTGLNTTEYTIESENNIVINGSSALIVGVHLECNIHETPWCMTPKQLELTLNDLSKKLSRKEYADLKRDLEKHKVIQPKT